MGARNDRLEEFMQVNSFLLNVTSEDPARLGAFYRDVVALPPNPDIGENAFNLNGAMFMIDGHSETKGQAKEPHRVLIDFFVDDLAAEQSRLEGRGVKFIRTAGKEEWGGVISTFLDPDGNFCQLIEYKPA
ncbi:MAG: VOC family protein [Chloroflexi bacterium]|nr:VOC family protein [Chloroflexota bacterium]